MNDLETVKIIRTSTDFGATCYTYNRFNVGECIDIRSLEADGRIRDTYDRDDWTAGDYTFALDTEALYLTGTGEMLWQSERMHTPTYAYETANRKEVNRQ